MSRDCHLLFQMAAAVLDGCSLLTSRHAACCSFTGHLVLAELRPSCSCRNRDHAVWMLCLESFLRLTSHAAAADVCCLLSNRLLRSPLIRRICNWPERLYLAPISSEVPHLPHVPPHAPTAPRASPTARGRVGRRTNTVHATLQHVKLLMNWRGIYKYKYKRHGSATIPPTTYHALSSGMRS